MLMSPMRHRRTNEQTTSKYRATQLLICEPLSFAIIPSEEPVELP